MLLLLLLLLMMLLLLLLRMMLMMLLKLLLMMLMMLLKLLLMMLMLMQRMANDGWVGEYFGQTTSHSLHATSLFIITLLSRKKRHDMARRFLSILIQISPE